LKDGLLVVFEIDASMGPRLCRRGNTLEQMDTLRQMIPASMGPRLCRRGNDGFIVVSIRSYTLQWGHVFVDVEI